MMDKTYIGKQQLLDMISKLDDTALYNSDDIIDYISTCVRAYPTWAKTDIPKQLDNIL